MKLVIYIIFLFLLLSPYIFAGELYRWVDKDGVVHVTDDPSTIPHEYRQAAEWSPEESISSGNKLDTLTRLRNSYKELLGKSSKFLRESGGKKFFVIVFVVVLISLILIPLAYLRLRQHREKEAWFRSVSLQDIQNMEKDQFERYIRRILSRQGFRTQETKISQDSGLDIVAKKNDIKYAVHFKRDIGLISSQAVEDVVSERNRRGYKGAMVVTNSYFTGDALELARAEGCELVNRDTLAEWCKEL